MGGNRCVWWQLLHFLLAIHFLFLSELCPAAQGNVTICTFQGGGIKIFHPEHPARPYRVLPASFWPPTFSHMEGGAPAPVLLPRVGSCLQVFCFLLLWQGNREARGASWCVEEPSSQHLHDADAWIREKYKGKWRTPGSNNLHQQFHADSRWPSGYFWGTF